MKIISCLLVSMLLFSCHEANKEIKKKQENHLSLDLAQANKLAELPLSCMETEYPNKLSQVIGSDDDIAPPRNLHPAFYGCFDWHSAVHGHWSLVRLLKGFPDLEKAELIRTKLKERMSKKNIEEEIKYFNGPLNKTYERTYGWAWLLKLAEELHTWDDPLGQELEANLQPLTNLIAQKYTSYLPKLQYPIRVGTHTNTAFGMSFAYDYAITLKDDALKNAIEKRAKDFFLNDKNAPLDWEPSGYDFLSPTFEEIDIMRKVLPQGEFTDWLVKFVPNIHDLDLAPGIVSDRTDGHMVHLDGLNFSRAWCMYALARDYHEASNSLRASASKHLEASLPSIFNDTYEGGHWLGSFALYALDSRF